MIALMISPSIKDRVTVALTVVISCCTESSIRCTVYKVQHVYEIRRRKGMRAV